MKMDQTEKLILEAIDQHRDEIIEFARDIYDHGELGYKEFNTAEKFIKKMKELGLRTETGLAITGTKAYLNEEKKDTASRCEALPRIISCNPETLHLSASLRLQESQCSATLYNLETQLYQ